MTNFNDFLKEQLEDPKLNSSMKALREAQAAFMGEAERLGLKDESDVVSMMKVFRQE